MPATISCHLSLFALALRRGEDWTALLISSGSPDVTACRVVKRFCPPEDPCHYKPQFYITSPPPFCVFGWKRFWLFGHGLCVRCRLHLEPAIQLLLSLLDTEEYQVHSLLTASCSSQPLATGGTSLGHTPFAGRSVACPRRSVFSFPVV